MIYCMVRAGINTAYSLCTACQYGLSIYFNVNPVSENLYITSTGYWVAITGGGGSMYQSSLVPRPLPQGEEGPGDEASTRGNIQSSAELKASLQSHSCVWLMHPCIVIVQTVQCQLSYSHAHCLSLASLFPSLM